MKWKRKMIDRKDFFQIALSPVNIKFQLFFCTPDFCNNKRRYIQLINVTCYEMDHESKCSFF